MIVASCSCVLTPHFLVAAAESDVDDESYDSNAESEAATNTSVSEAATDVDEDELDEDELEGLEEDLKMPATRSGKRSSKSASPVPSRRSHAPPAVENLIRLTEGMAVSDTPITNSKWYSPNSQLPFVTYAFKDENNPIRHLKVDLMMPGHPDEFIRKVEVKPCGTKLSVVLGTPRWFFESAYLVRTMGPDYHPQHAGVDNFEENVVQPVRKKFKENNAWIESAPCIIDLPEKCYVGDATWTRGYFETANRPAPDGHIQYTWIVRVNLKTTKTFELRNAAAAAANYAAAGAM